MTMLQIPIAKAGNRPIEIDTDQVPDAVYSEIFAEGLKVMLNKRMSKIGSVTKLVGAEQEKAHADAMKIAEENKANILAGIVSKARATTAKVAGVVMTEARRLAKEVVKDAIRAAGMKLSTVEASEITKAANELIATDKSYIERATANIEARKAKAPAATDAEAAKAAKDLLSSLGGVHESAKLIAKAEKAKAEKPLSKTQAGKVAPRAKPATEAHHAN